MTVRYADYQQMPVVVFQLSEICLISPPLASHYMQGGTLQRSRFSTGWLSCSMTTVALQISNGKNTSLITSNHHSVKAQIPSSGLLPRSIALSCTSLLFFYHL